MSAMTAPHATTTRRPILLRLPFSVETVDEPPRSASSPRRDDAFAPGAWERLIVAAELDRESRELSPTP